jgi:farnesyl-diphosphate farnesyltransferase
VSGAEAGADARAYCRRVLPLVSRTFAINIELLDGRMRDTVRVAYLLCRAADALEDSWPGAPAEITERFARFVDALGGDPSAATALASGAALRPGARDDLQLLAHLPTVLAALGLRELDEQAIVRTCLRTMSAGMSRFASRAAGRPADACYLDSEAELREYCWIVAGCVGAMLTALFERRLLVAADPARERRRELAPVVGEALQLTNILLDLPGDLRRGRCYLPADWLAAHGLAPRDFLGGPRPEAREVALRLESRAHDALDRVADYLETVPGRFVRYRLFCLWPALWARGSLRLVHRDPHFPFRAERARLSRGQIWSAAARSLLVAHDARGVRRMLAQG